MMRLIMVSLLLSSAKLSLVMAQSSEDWPPSAARGAQA